MINSTMLPKDSFENVITRNDSSIISRRQFLLTCFENYIEKAPVNFDSPKINDIITNSNTIFTHYLHDINNKSSESVGIPNQKGRFTRNFVPWKTVQETFLSRINTLEEICNKTNESLWLSDINTFYNESIDTSFDKRIGFLRRRSENVFLNTSEKDTFNDIPSCESFIESLTKRISDIHDKKESYKKTLSTEKFTILYSFLHLIGEDIAISLDLRKSVATSTNLYDPIEYITTESKEEYINYSTEAATAEGTSGKIQNAILNFKSFINKAQITNHRKFFKQYLGKLAHMYDRYGSDAVMKENTLRKDPLDGLKDLQNFISKCISDSQKWYIEHIKLLDQLSKSSSLEEIKKTIIKTYKIDLDDYKSFKKQLRWQIRERFANILYSELEPYGYTKRSLIEKNEIPKPGHLAVSLLIENPEEVPKEQTVKDVFKNAKSLEIMGSDSFPRDVTNFTKKTSQIIINTLQSEDVEKIYVHLKDLKRLVKSLKKDGKEEDLKQAKALINEIKSSYYYGPLKLLRYCLELTKSYINIYKSVLKSGKVAVVALLNVESKKLDDREGVDYNTKTSKQSAVDASTRHSKIDKKREQSLKEKEEN